MFQAFIISDVIKNAWRRKTRTTLKRNHSYNTYTNYTYKSYRRRYKPTKLNGSNIRIAK
ncbi:hypothetical protein [Thermohalobacter berrensis]|nr:hypothetical protein [Thermohalobacter berrensis]